MNPGVVALDQLVERRAFFKASLPGATVVQYFSMSDYHGEDWQNVAGLVHVASSWVNIRGLSVIRGRSATEIVYIYRPEEDR